MEKKNVRSKSTCSPNDNNINEDSLAKVLGAEKRERIRGFGFRVTPLQVLAQIQSVERVKQLEAELEVTNDQLLNKGVQVEDAVSSHACTPSHVFTTQSQHGSVSITQDMSQFENARCHLLHWYPNDDYEDQIVAEGMISSTNPKDKVHTMPLGRGYWRVWVDAVFHDIKVCRSTDEYETLS
ncbi:hypothetical protein ACOSQ4_006719 [Xanthoceras sorbifolium]